MNKINIFWFRRDLRLHDNHGLFEALQSNLKVQPIFIFDRNILDELPEDDQRVTYIHDHLLQMQQTLKKYEASLDVYEGNPADIFENLFAQKNIEAVFCNQDYEPYATDRDNEIGLLCEKYGVKFCSYKDHLIFHKNEVVKSDGTPYLVYTPYMKAWRNKLTNAELKEFPSQDYLSNLNKKQVGVLLTLQKLGFIRSSKLIADVSLDYIKDYDKWRDIPGKNLTSFVGTGLRFGTISIRSLAKRAFEINEVYLNELVWREFFSMLLWHYPRVVTENFKSKYDAIPWLNDKDQFKKWCKGETGFPIIDAGMRQLNETGFMHNRVRMIVASFLTKNLLIDWRWGEAYFAQKLMDYDLASNVMNWQWVAGTGVDAAPYFRVFNPTTQALKFDADQSYIKCWLTDDEINFSRPMVDLSFTRKRAIETYKKALNGTA